MEFSEMQELVNEVDNSLNSDVPSFVDDSDLGSYYTDEINEHISSVEELEIYQDEGLVQQDVNNRPCLVQSDIDLSIKDDFGRSNLERASNGLAPLDNNGDPYELHHINQGSDAPLAELKWDTHRGSDNYSILHGANESEINRSKFGYERAEHWKERSQYWG
jgi:hypothetical protein